MLARASPARDRSDCFRVRGTGTRSFYVGELKHCQDFRAAIYLPCSCLATGISHPRGVEQQKMRAQVWDIGMSHTSIVGGTTERYSPSTVFETRDVRRSPNARLLTDDAIQAGPPHNGLWWTSNTDSVIDLVYSKPVYTALVPFIRLCTSLIIRHSPLSPFTRLPSFPFSLFPALALPFSEAC